MKYLLFAFLFTSIFNDSAFAKVKCSIQNLSDAEKCMKKVDEDHTSGETPNNWLASQNTGGLVKVLRLLGLKKTITDRAAKSDFAGILIENGDEEHIYYFGMNKGTDVSPVEYYDLNTVDLDTILEKPYSQDALDIRTYFLGLNVEKLWIYDNMKERLNELKGSE